MTSIIKSFNHRHSALSHRVKQREESRDFFFIRFRCSSKAAASGGIFFIHPPKITWWRKKKEEAL
jgi:hypothetical protein